jgi:cholera toxin transcriptional activator
VVRFGVFEIDLRTAELRKQGQRLRIPGQSFQVLQLLLERPGELVSREEFRETIWGSDTFVDFEHGLNAAVNRLREALGDSADSPRFVETLPRRGYRFIAPLQGVGEGAPVPEGEPDRDAKGTAGSMERSPLRRFFLLFGSTPYRRWK